MSTGRASTIANINAIATAFIRYTPIWDAIWDGITLARTSPNIPVVVAMTDGEDYSSWRNNYNNDDTHNDLDWNYSTGTPFGEFPDGDPLGQIGLDDGNTNDDYNDSYDPSGDGDGGICMAPIHVFTIGLNIGQDEQNCLREIANTSAGGEYYYAPDSNDLDTIYNDIAGIVSQLGGSASTGSTETISAGDSLIYRLYYNNTGIGNASNVWVNDTLPPPVTYIADNASVPYSYTNGQYSWHFSNVTPGSHWFWIEVEIDNTVVNNQTIVNQVFLNYTDSEGNGLPGSNDTVSVTVSEPVITIAKVVTTPSIEPGELLNYTIYYNNTGSAMALFVWINDSFDPHVTYISDSAPVAPVVNGNNYSWMIPEVFPGNYTFNITVRVNDNTPGGTVIGNTVTAEFTNEDNVLHNESSISNEVNTSVSNTVISVEKVVNSGITDPSKLLTDIGPLLLRKQWGTPGLRVQLHRCDTG